MMPREIEELIADFRQALNIVIAERIKIQDNLEQLLDPAADEHF
jgi:hypothetical protein